MKCSLWLASVAGLFIPLVAGAQQPATPAAPTPVTVTGYVTTGLTHSTEPVANVIVGRAYDRRQDEFMLNVANIALDRSAPTDRMSAGFHFEGLFGQNAEVVKSNGLNLGPDADIWQAYVVLNAPLSGKDRYVQIKAGKMATLMGVEVGEDILNPNLGIGYQDIFLEPFTETGVEFDGKFSPRVDAELRVSNGWDQVTDLNAGKTFMARMGLTPDDKTLFAIVGYTGPEQANNTSNRRTGVNALLSRKLSVATTAQAQVDYGQEDGAAAGGGEAKWYAAGLWTTVDLNPTATLAMRGDYMNDRDGARTSGVLGFPVTTGLTVASLTATWNDKQWDHALVRPELRYDHASRSVFKGNQSQLSIGIGLSYLF